MSFVRFGQDGSHVYIYNDVRGYKICCGCILSKIIRQRTDEELNAAFPHLNAAYREHWRNLYEPDFHTNDLNAMLAHTAEHRAAGHTVPDWVDQALRDEWEDE